MSEPFLGEIRMCGFKFAPVGWALCNGQLLSVQSNQALFALLGTAYGGDGVNTFGVPDLRGRVPIHQGDGPATSPYVMGQSGGSETVTLGVAQIPAHNHTLAANYNAPTTNNPTGAYVSSALVQTGDVVNSFAGSANATMNAAAVGNAGGSQGHANIQPYLCVNFIISLQGLFPARN